MEISVVIAAPDSAPDIGPCLEALMPQLAGRAAEVLLAANPGHPGIAAAATRWPSVIPLVADHPLLVPELWGLGVMRATGAVVAITISGCVPEARWVDAILEAHRGSDAGIGGAIDPAPESSWIDWAVYFVRYAPYMRPFPDRTVADIPGDNGTYKRARLSADLATIAREGFWEVPVNAALRARGESLRMTPAIVVHHTHSYGLASFSRQRWEHGRRFGRSRAAGMGAGARAARVALAPVTLAVMLVRVARELSRRGKHLGRFALALPLVAWFYACWLGGEATGLAKGGT